MSHAIRWQHQRGVAKRARPRNGLRSVRGGLRSVRGGLRSVGVLDGIIHIIHIRQMSLGWMAIVRCRCRCRYRLDPHHHGVTAVALIVRMHGGDCTIGTYGSTSTGCTGTGTAGGVDIGIATFAADSYRGPTIAVVAANGTVGMISVATTVTEIPGANTIAAANSIVCRNTVADQDIIAIYIITIHHIAIHHIIGTHDVTIAVISINHITVIYSSHDVTTVATTVAAAIATITTTIHVNVIITAREHGAIAGIGPHTTHSSGRRDAAP